MKAPLGAFFFVMNYSMKQLNDALLIWQISTVVLMAIGTAITFWMLYLVIRAGVRDGIRQARRDERRASPRGTPPMGNTGAAGLPEMHVD